MPLNLPIPPSWKKDGKLVLAGPAGAELVVLVVPCPPAQKYLPASVCVTKHGAGLYRPCQDCRLGPERGADHAWKSGLVPHNGGRYPKAVAAPKPTPEPVPDPIPAPAQPEPRRRGPAVESGFDAAWVATILERTGLSQLQLGQRVGLSHFTIWLILQGKSRVTAKSRDKILAVFPEAADWK